MTRSVLVGLMAVLAAAPAAGQVRGDKYVPEGGRYSIRFPGKPRVKEQTAESKLGDLPVVTATYANSDGSVFLVAYTDFPDGAAKPEARDAHYDSVRDKLKEKNGKLIDETAITVGPDKIAGREIEVERDKKRMKFRVVLHDGRLYQFAVIGTSTFVKSRDAKSFLDSFELTK